MWHTNAISNVLVQAVEEIRNLADNEIMAARIQQDIRDAIQRNQEVP